MKQMTSSEPAKDAALLRSFGRRRGRKLSPRQEQLLQELLPRLRVDLSAPAPSNSIDLFSAPVTEVWLEIGFGGAEHLLWQAQNRADVGIIGAEPFEEGVVKALHGIEQSRLANVRLYDDDARPLIDWLQPASIAKAFVLFPDPWPKKRHAKRRLVSRRLLSGLKRVLKPGGELRLGTDIASYAREMLLALRQEGGFTWCATTAADWRQRPADWPQTRYEAKAHREGRAPTYLILKRD